MRVTRLCYSVFVYFQTEYILGNYNTVHIVLDVFSVINTRDKLTPQVDEKKKRKKKLFQLATIVSSMQHDVDLPRDVINTRRVVSERVKIFPLFFFQRVIIRVSEL